MHRSSTSAVRLLAAWQQRRRELSDRLDTLLLHGPTAVDRVSSRAGELRAALEAERAAFEAFVEVASQPETGTAPPDPTRTSRRPGTAPDDGQEDGGPDVVDLVVYPRLRAVTDAGT